MRMRMVGAGHSACGYQQGAPQGGGQDWRAADRPFTCSCCLLPATSLSQRGMPVPGPARTAGPGQRPLRAALGYVPAAAGHAHHHLSQPGRGSPFPTATSHAHLVLPLVLQATAQVTASQRQLRTKHQSLQANADQWLQRAELAVVRQQVCAWWGVGVGGGVKGGGRVRSI